MLGAGWVVIGTPPDTPGLDLPRSAEANLDGGYGKRELETAAKILGIQKKEAEDFLMGACETLAIKHAEAVTSLLRRASPGDRLPNVSKAAILALNEELGQLSFKEQCAEVFAPELRGRRNAQRRLEAMVKPLNILLDENEALLGEGGHETRRRKAPGSLAHLADAAAPVPAELLDGSEYINATIHRMKEYSRRCQDGLCSVPIIRANYIWGAEGCTASETANKGEEVAQYSTHMIVLTFDSRAKVVYVCDPNGSILRGGNLEFVSIPVKMRRSKPSTWLSQHDIDTRAGGGAFARRMKWGGGGGGGCASQGAPF